MPLLSRGGFALVLVAFALVLLSSFSSASIPFQATVPLSQCLDNAVLDVPIDSSMFAFGGVTTPTVNIVQASYSFRKFDDGPLAVTESSCVHTSCSTPDAGAAVFNSEIGLSLTAVSSGTTATIIPVSCFLQDSLYSGPVTMSFDDAGIAMCSLNSPTSAVWAPFTLFSSTLRSLPARDTWRFRLTDSGKLDPTCPTEVRLTIWAFLQIDAPTVTPPLCFSGTDGSAVVSVVGGTGTYRITAFTVAQMGRALPSYVGTTFTGSVTLSGLQGNSDYTVSVEDVTDANSRGSYTFNVPHPPQLQVSVTPTPVTCFSYSTGSLSVSITGGTSPWSYRVNGGAPTATSSGSNSVGSLAANSYTVAVTDANGCQASGSAVVSQPDKLRATASHVDVLCAGGSTGSITISLTPGTVNNPPYRYFIGGTQIGMPTTALSLTQGGYAAGTYSILVRDNNNCPFPDAGDASIDQVISGPATAVAITSASVSTEVFCSGQSTGVVTFSASGGTTPLTASLTGVTPTQSAPSSFSNAQFTGLAYVMSRTLTVHDANNCQATQVLNMATPPTRISLTVTQSASSPCNGDAQNYVEISAQNGNPGTYTVSKGATTLYTSSTVPNDLRTFGPYAAGLHTFTVLDSRGCSNSQDITLTEPTALQTPTTTASSPSCAAGQGTSNNGRIVVNNIGGGRSPYDLLLDGTVIATGQTSTSYTFNGLSAGTYTVTVRDANGCTRNAIRTVNAISALGLTAGTTTNVLCNGASTGQLTYTIANAPTFPVSGSLFNTITSATTGPYSFGSASASISGLGQGTYRLTITIGGCSFTQTTTTTITENPAVTFTVTAVDSVCPTNTAGTKGSITVTPSGGSNMGYAISTNGGSSYVAGVSASSLNPQTYSVRVRDSNNCQSAAQNVIISGPSNISPTFSNTAVTCSGGSDGQVGITAITGGTAGYTVAINGGTATAWTASTNYPGLSAGTQNVVITDSQNCQRTTTTSIGAGLAVSFSTTSSEDRCPSPGTGTVTVTPGGGQSSNVLVSLTPNPGSLGGVALPYTASALAAGSYTATVRHPSTGCTSSTLLSVAAGTPPSLTFSDRTCTGDMSATVLLCAAGGYPDYQVALTTPMSCATPSPSTFTITPPMTGPACQSVTSITFGCSYTARLTDARGCVINTAVTIVVTPPSAVNIASTVTNPTCPMASTGSAAITITNGPAPYQTISVSPTVAGFTTLTNQASGTSFSLTNLRAGTYTVSVVDANNCPSNAGVTLTDPTPVTLTPTPTAPSCPSNAAAGTTNNGQIAISATGGTGSITLRYMSSVITSPLTNLAAGSYTITGTDSNNCVGSVIATVPPAPAFALSVTGLTDALCPDPSDPQYSSGSFTASITGGSGSYTSIALKAGSTTVATAPASPATFSSLPPQSYVVEVVDSNSCTYRPTVNINAPTAFSFTATDVSCTGNPLLSISAVAGGTGGLTVQVTPASGMATATATPPTVFSGLPTATDLTLRISDSRGCYVDRLLPQLQPVPAALAIAVTPTNPAVACFGGTVNVNLALSGGSPNYQFGKRLQPAATYTNTANVMSGNRPETLTAGTWDFILTDSHGCTMASPQSVTVTQPGSALSATSSITNPTCNGRADGSLTVTPTGGTAPYTGNPALTLSGLTAGSHSITITDNNGCTFVETRSLTNPSSPSATLVVTAQPTCSGFTNGAVTFTVSGGQGSMYTYTLSFNGGPASMPQAIMSSITINNLGAGTYTAIGYDAAGCPSPSRSVTLTETSVSLAMVASSTPVSCNSGSDGSILVQASGGNAPYTFSRGSGTPFTMVPVNSQRTFGSLSAGSYTIVVTDASGCSIQQILIVAQPNLLTVTPSFTPPLCVDSLTTVTLSISGGTSSYSTVMSGTASGSATGAAPSFSNLALGSYTFQTTDNRGCIASATVSLTVASPLAVTVSDRTCFTDSNGRIFVQPSGGTPSGSNYQVRLSGSITGPYTVPTTGATVSAQENVLVTVTVTDSNMCTATTTIRPNKPTLALSSTVTSRPSTCHLGNGLDNGVIEVTLSGGTGPYTGTLSPDPTMVGQVSSSMGVLTFNNVPGNSAGGATTINILDRNQCPYSTSIVVSSPPPLAVLVDEKTRVICSGDATASLESQLTGGNGRPYSITRIVGPYSVPLPLGLSIPNLRGGTYTIDYRDARGCTISASYTITNPSVFTAPVSLSMPITCYNNANGELTLNITGGEPPYYLRIVPPPMSPYPAVITMPGIYQLTGLTEATYSIFIRDDRACEVPYQDITLSQPGFLTILKPVGGAEFFMYRPYEIQYRYEGGQRDQLVDVDLHGPSGLRYSLARLQSATAFNGTVQITIPHHIIPGKYRLRVGNTLCINEFSGQYVVHASRETLQNKN